jgi:hypothetical protein
VNNGRYFETRFTDCHGDELPRHRYDTLDEAWAEAHDLSSFSRGGLWGGSIWYRHDAESEPVELVRMKTGTNARGEYLDDGTDFPLDGLDLTIEPGAFKFSLWVEDPDGLPKPYDFGFVWDGGHDANWQCSRCAGTMTWANQHDDRRENNEEIDDLGNDLLVTYTASLATGEVSGQTLIKDAAVLDPRRRDAWVFPARRLFEFLRSQNLI